MNFSWPARGSNYAKGLASSQRELYCRQKSQFHLNWTNSPSHFSVEQDEFVHANALHAKAIIAIYAASFTNSARLVTFDPSFVGQGN